MFSTFKQRLLLGVYIFLILSIPLGAFVVSQFQTNLKSKAQEPKNKLPIVKTSPISTSSAAQNLANLYGTLGSKSTLPTPEPSTTTATSFGPTLSLKVSLEARTPNNQKTRLFVGILEGSVSSNPKFLLSFTVDLPSSGEYSNISLAGLTTGNRYTALLKGSAQIATASAFIMSPTVSNLNSNQAINMLSGDLNDDNTINSADYSIAQKALGSTSKSANWNENADLNKDGVVNTLDLAIIIKNFGKTGDSGTWISPLPKTATPSAGLANPVGSPDQQGGYWLWIPK